jgi:hypothetical protein
LRTPSISRNNTFMTYERNRPGIGSREAGRAIPGSDSPRKIFARDVGFG